MFKSYNLNASNQTAEVTYKSYTNYKYNEGWGITTADIPSSVEYNYATYSVTSIGDRAFYDCTGLTSINVASDNSNYCSVDGVLFNKDKTTLIQYPGGKQGAYTIPNSVTSIGEDAFRDCTGLTSVTIPNSVTSIGDDAFFDCTGLTSVTIGNSVTSIGDDAFRDCSGLTSITCEAVTPPTCVGTDVFYYVDKSIPLYVPAGSVYKYKAADQWKDFGDNIKPIQAEQVEVVQPNAEPTTNSVVIEWPKKDDAVTYTIIIKKGTEIICTLSFNEQGQLLRIAFAAPARNDRSHQAQMATQMTTGWQYTISGLEPNTEYTYTVIAKRSDDSEVYNTTVPFKTQETATSLNQTSQEPIANSQKLLINGQIFILRGDKTYTIQGQEVR